jgi:hypothetical protein
MGKRKSVARALVLSSVLDSLLEVEDVEEYWGSAGMVVCEEK